MTRRQFIGSIGAASFLGACQHQDGNRADVAILGGGVGGCAAALAALELGLTVVLTEETPWIGGQLTQQAVPPDEHEWIETQGSSALYREFRKRIRDSYRSPGTLRQIAFDNPLLNPGGCAVSTICHEPRRALAVLEQMLAEKGAGRLTLLRGWIPIRADVDGDRVRAVEIESVNGVDRRVIEARMFLDATETGELLPLTGTEYVTGSESHSETGELHASVTADPSNMQAATWCFALGYRPGEDQTINRPDSYAYWRDYVPELTPPWPGRLLDLTYSNPITLEPRQLDFDPRPAMQTERFNLWIYRRLINPDLYMAGSQPDAASLINWPQNDYLEGNLFGGSPEEDARHLHRARELSLSLLYWLQTEAPRSDGGQGWPGLVPRGDITGTKDGLALKPYIRESRRIRAVTTICEQHVGLEDRMLETGLPSDEVEAYRFDDSVGTGYYRLDLHPSTGGDNYIDIPSLRFQIPMGALIPIRLDNLIPACKNIGSTHITNGCYRLHPIEWVIGEAAGTIAAFCLQHEGPPRHVRAQPAQFAHLRKILEQRGVDCEWKDV